MPCTPAPLAAALTACALAAIAACTTDARAPLAQFEVADRTPWSDPAYDDVLDVVELTVDRIQGDYAAGRYSALELVQAYLARIDTFEQVYNAFVSMNGDALETAARLDEEYRRSGPRGPLHGVPLVIKDNMDYGGMVTTAGYEGFSAATGGIDMIPGSDAVVVTRLRDAGAIVLGKTNMPDFALDGTRTRSTVAGETRNPWDLTRAPGGSSGGTATAVNASFATLGLGTETGGSIQNPSAAQGLVGVKPTFGLVPLEGILPVDATYRDVVGPIARTVRDAALALDAMAGPTPADPNTSARAHRIPAGSYAVALSETSLRGKRFGLVGTGWREQFLPLAPETDQLYECAIEALRARGAQVVEDPFRDSGWRERHGERPSVPGITTQGLFVYLRGLGPAAAFRSQQEWERLSGREFPGMALGGVGSTERPAADEVADAFTDWQGDMRMLFRSVLADHDLDGLFFPQAGGPTRPLLEDPDRPDYSPNNHPELPSNIVNEVGLPVVTVPVGYYADGMPFVVAFIGDLWTDGELLGFAYDLEQATRTRAAPTLSTDTIR